MRFLIPALKPGVKIVLNELVVLEPEKIPKGDAERIRANDLVMSENYSTVRIAR